MLKKLGLVSVGVTAGLMAAAPFASASESQDGDCNVISESNNEGVERCNVFGQGNGRGNTFNGVEAPGFPEAPELPDFPGFSEFLPELPSQFVVPGV